MKINFTENEKMLLCGDATTESWKEIPAAQVEFTLRNYLKQRAYYKPTFHFHDDTLSVDPGPLKQVTSLTFEGAPKDFDQIKLRDIVGSPLTSTLLDQVQDFTLSRLKNLGFACPNVKLQASEDIGAVHVWIVTGPEYYFLQPELTENIGLYPQAMRRFDAFELNAPFRYEWVKLTTNRAENDGIVVSSQFNFTCPDNPLATTNPQGLIMKQTILGGEKHLVTIGAGASTEEFPIAELSWKSVRLNENGANLSVNSHLSQRIQDVTTTFTDYIFKNAPRADFAPNITIEHDAEETYTTTELQFGVPLEYHGDFTNTSYLTSFGPAISRYFSNDTAQSDTSINLFSLVGRLGFTSHDYELYQNDPRSGFVENLNVAMLSENVNLDALAMVYNFTGSNLFPLNPVDPPQWILGLRYGLATTQSTERPETSDKLPPQYFETLGGDQNLRGFGRNQLADGTVGGMTSVYLSTELRYAKTVLLGPVIIEPFLFFDAGALGDQPFDLESTVYYSPGLGVRLSTPVGAIRSTLAHGYLSKDAVDGDGQEHIQFFISFGQEF
jgi:translocation and assembly module TamA